MSDLIYKQDAIELVMQYCPDDDGTCSKANEDIRNLLDELEALPSARPERKGWVHVDDIYRLISGHSNYHGDNILAALTCLAEGKEVLKPIAVLDTQPERKKGKWVKEYWNGEHARKCSVCNITQTVTIYRGKVKFNYCPYCGADIRGTEDD